MYKLWQIFLVSVISVILFITVCLCVDQNDSTQTHKTKLNGRRNRSPLRRDGIVSDVIDTVPKYKITVKYPSGVEANFGNELTPTQVKDKPTISWPSELDAYYTLVMTDPDAPTRSDPIFGEFKHWLVINIAGSDVVSGQVLADYKGSGPPKDTGLHRYIFLVYRQPKLIEHPVSTTDLAKRSQFKIRNFAKDNNLGQPIAVNYFMAQWDGKLG
ncbi:protein D3-like [Oppia nitens]|uniref:protein D3-like n=1 Tax=Oppia nitens TaxID=1686743 RepID=UPI0023DAC6C7|nr:protein D3-like [Oppia nitens]